MLSSSSSQDWLLQATLWDPISACRVSRFGKEVCTVVVRPPLYTHVDLFGFLRKDFVFFRRASARSRRETVYVYTLSLSAVR